MYQLKETVFERLEDIGIHVDNEVRLFTNFAVFDFESITVADNTLKNSDSTTWIGRHVPISVSISYSFGSGVYFLCNSDPKQLVRDFIEKLLEVSQLSSVLVIEKFERVFNDLNEKITECEQFSDEVDNASSTVEEGSTTETDSNILDIGKLTLKSLYQLRDDLNKYCVTLPIFGFNSSRYDLNLIKEYLLEILLYEKKCSPSVIRKANQFLGMSFSGLQFLDILSFLGGATSLDKFLKAYGSEEQKGFFPYEWFNSPEKLNETKLPSIDDFYSKLKCINVLEVDFLEFRRLQDQGYGCEASLKKMKLKQIPKTKEENYAELEIIWRQKNMQVFKDFLEYYNNKDVVPTMTAMQRMVAYYHSKNIDMLKLGLTLPNLANNILHSSTDAKFFPFGKADSWYDSYIRQNLTGDPSIIFTRYAIAAETRIRDSQNICNAVIGIDASQLYPYSMMKEMPTGPYYIWEYSNDSNKYHRQKPTRSMFELMVFTYLQEQKPNCQIKSQFTARRQKRFGPFSVDGYCQHCETAFEADGCFFHFCACQDHKHHSEEELKRGLVRRERTVKRKQYLQSLGLQVVTIRECQWWEWARNNQYGVGVFLKTHFSYKKPITEKELTEKMF